MVSFALIKRLAGSPMPRWNKWKRAGAGDFAGYQSVWSPSIIQNLLYTRLPYVDVKTTVDWREQHKVLKLEFPECLKSTPTYEIAFGAIQRPADGEEEPGLHWFDVSGDRKKTQSRACHHQ